MENYEIKKSKVQTVKYDGKWQDLHKYFITFENGDKGTYFSKSDNQDKFKAPLEADYKFDELKNRIKVHYAEPFQNKNSGSQSKTNDRELYIIRQSSLKAALEYHAQVGQMEEQLLETADMFTDYVLTGKKPQTNKHNDNLPF